VSHRRLRHLTADEGREGKGNDRKKRDEKCKNLKQSKRKTKVQSKAGLTTFTASVNTQSSEDKGASEEKAKIQMSIYPSS
jgi:hypothetical protein